MPSHNPLLRSALIVFTFWWLFFTLWHYDWSLIEVFRHWTEILRRMQYWLLFAVLGAASAALHVWCHRRWTKIALKSTQSGGLQCSLGPVPMPAKAPSRIRSEKHRLPIASAVVRSWIETAKKEHPRHADLFLAVWDIYSEHPDWPASHRIGGHGGRRLWEHCLGVVETSLATAAAFKYEGVTLKTKGKRANTIIGLLDSEYLFDAADPLIPVLALAHDIGKLEAYKAKADGTVGVTATGAGQAFDDLGVPHDALGARILARLPEFWALPPGERRIVSLVIAHYHHPGSFPVERDGSSLGDRLCSLLQFLIVADKETGRAESGLVEVDDADAPCEDESTEIYNAFVEIVTEDGRVSGGSGANQQDTHFLIGAKHGQLVVLKESRVRALLMAKLNRPNDGGSSASLGLLSVLAEKGLLHAEIRGIDFRTYLPLWNVDFYGREGGKHIMSWDGCFIIALAAAAGREFDALTSLRSKQARMELTRPTFAHNDGIADPHLLRSLLHQAFDQAIAQSVSIPKARAELVGSLEDAAQSEHAISGGDAYREAPVMQVAVSGAIRDEDAAPSRDFMNGPKAQESLQLLHAASAFEAPAQPPRKRKRRKEPLTVEALQELVERFPSYVAGERDGHRWVFQNDLNRIAGAEAFLDAQTTLLLPIHDAGRGLRYLGIPSKEAQKS